MTDPSDLLSSRSKFRTNIARIVAGDQYQTFVPASGGQSCIHLLADQNYELMSPGSLLSEVGNLSVAPHDLGAYVPEEEKKKHAYWALTDTGLHGSTRLWVYASTRLRVYASANLHIYAFMRLRVYACTRLRVYTSTSLRAYYTCVCRAESRNRLTIPCNDAMAGNTGWHCHPVIGYRSANTLPGKMCYDHSYKLGTTTTTIFFVCVSVCLRCFFLLYEVGVCPCLCLLYLYIYIYVYVHKYNIYMF